MGAMADGGRGVRDKERRRHELQGGATATGGGDRGVVRRSHRWLGGRVRREMDEGPKGVGYGGVAAGVAQGGGGHGEVRRRTCHRMLEAI